MTSSPTVPTPTVRIKNPPDLLAALPYLLGFHPRESLVVLAFGPGRRVSMTQRIDLPAPEHAPTVCAVLAGNVLRAGPAGAGVLIVSGAPPGGPTPPHAELAAVAHDELRRRAVPVRLQAWAASTTAGAPWACYDECGCRGTLPDPATRPLAATAVAAGVVVHGDRAELERLVAPVAAAVLRRRERLLTRAVDAAARGAGTPPLDGLGGWTGPASGVPTGPAAPPASRPAEHASRAATPTEPASRAATPTEPAPADSTGTAGPAGSTRAATPNGSAGPVGSGAPAEPPGSADAVVAAAMADAATGRLHLDDGRVLALALALSDPLVRDEALVRSAAPDAVGVEHLWAALTRETPDPEAAEPATLLAACALLRGDGALAGIALDRAERAWPGHRLSGLLRIVWEAGMSPEQVRECLVSAPLPPAAQARRRRRAARR